jgi:hypothetical protein
VRETNQTSGFLKIPTSGPPQAGMAHGTPLYRDISENILINK